MNILNLVTRILQEMIRDKRTLALLFLAPIFILTLMHFIFDTKESDVSLVATIDQPAIEKSLESSQLDVTIASTYSKQKMAEHDIDGWLDQTGKTFQLYLLNNRPSRSEAVQIQLKQALTSQTNSIPLETTYVYGDQDTNLFDTFSPMLVGYFVFFFVFLIAGIALLKERINGTLERLLATPIKRYEIVFGYVVGYGLLALIQTLIVVFYATSILDIVSNGSIWYVLLINIVTAFVALSLGTLLSSFAASEFQMMQFIPLIVIPQVFFTGIFPLDGMADWLQSLGKIMPLYYTSDALHAVMYKGLGFRDIWLDITLLIGFAVLCIVLNIFSLRKHRSF